jgi:hypothetical protein
VRSSGWRSLTPYPLVERWNQVLELGPSDRHRRGVLANGMKYFVQRTFKPRERAALALAVDVGSIAEDLDERGVVHPTPYTLHPTPYTLHLTPFTLHPIPYTLHPPPSTLHPPP